MHENTEIRREARSISWQVYPSGRPRFIVVPAGIAFFHVTDSGTGQVRGFRQRHADVCELARQLDQSSPGSGR